MGMKKLSSSPPAQRHPIKHVAERGTSCVAGTHAPEVYQRCVMSTGKVHLASEQAHILCFMSMSGIPGSIFTVLGRFMLRLSTGSGHASLVNNFQPKMISCLTMTY